MEKDYEMVLNLLAEKWVAWNRKEMSGDDFAMQFDRLFPEYTKQAWRKDLRKRLLASTKETEGK